MLRKSGWALIAVLLSGCLPALAQPTPPVMPQVEAAPLPPAVTLPAPSSVPADVLTTQAITADEAALLALHYQPSLVQAQAAVTDAQGVTQEARSALGPQVTTSASYTHVTGSGGGISGGTGGTGTTTGTGLFAGYNLSATVRQLIYDFNHSVDLVRQASARQRSVGAGLTKAQSDLVFQVKQDFYTWAQDERLVAVAQENLTNQQAHLTEAQARLNTGLGLPSDVVRAQTAVADAIFALNQAQVTASLARTTLALQMGIDPRIPLQPADTPESAQLGEDFDQLTGQGLTRRPEIRVAQESLDATLFGLSAARTGDAPVVSGSAGWQDRDTHFPPDKNSLSLGVGVQWNVFDSGFTAGQVTQARAGVQSAQAALVSAKLSVVNEVAQAWLNLKTAQQHVATAAAEVANAREGVRLAEGRFRAGIGIFLDVLDAQAALVTAETNQVNSTTALNQAQAALAHAVNADPVLAQPPPPAILAPTVSH